MHKGKAQAIQRKVVCSKSPVCLINLQGGALQGKAGLWPSPRSSEGLCERCHAVFSYCLLWNKKVNLCVVLRTGPGKHARQFSTTDQRTPTSLQITDQRTFGGLTFPFHWQGKSRGHEDTVKLQPAGIISRENLGLGSETSTWCTRWRGMQENPGISHTRDS